MARRGSILIEPFKIAVDEYTPTRPRIIWPAVILAASRNERVIGRAIILTLSTSTRKGFNQSGAPPGSRLAVKVLGARIALERISLNHIVTPRGRAKIRWLEYLKV